MIPISFLLHPKSGALNPLLRSKLEGMKEEKIKRNIKPATEIINARMLLFKDSKKRPSYYNFKFLLKWIRSFEKKKKKKLNIKINNYQKKILFYKKKKGEGTNFPINFKICKSNESKKKKIKLNTLLDISIFNFVSKI